MKKINNIEISNFKSIKHLKIDGCKKINVFVGQPNAGKSNILEALGLFGFLDFTKSSVIESIVRFGSSDELFFEGNISQEIQISINSILMKIIQNKFSIKNDKEHYIGLKDELKYGFYSSEFANEMESNGSVSKLKKYSFGPEGDFNSSYNDKSLNFPYGEDLGRIISSYPKLRDVVNKFFKQNNLKVLIEKNTNELKVFKEFQDGTVFTLPYNLIADTLQRLIFYKAAIMSNEKSVLLFEEPEAHCFEPYILEFTNDVKYDENDNQFFIVTHSDFIIKEFLRDNESKENTNIYLVNNVDGETQVKLLEKDKNEDVFEYGMNVFFNFESLWETN